MFSLAIFIMFAAAFLSAENLVSTIVGGIAAVVGTQIFKVKTGASGAGATVLAFVVSLVVAVIAYALSMLISGTFSWDAIPAGAAQIFTLSTLAYRGLSAMTQPPTNE